MVPSQQMEMMNSQLMATQQQLQMMTDRYQDLANGHVVLLQQVVQLQKFVKNHDAVMKNVMGFLHVVDEQRRNSISGGPFGVGAAPPVGTDHIKMDDHPASPLQNATKLLEELPAEALPDQALEKMTHEYHIRDEYATPPNDPSGSGMVPRSHAHPHAAHQYPAVNDLDNMVYPVGHTNGIDPINSEHIHNIPYSLPANVGMVPVDTMPEVLPEGLPTMGRKQKHPIESVWGPTKPRILLVEDDKLCATIGSKFLQAFECGVEIAVCRLNPWAKLFANKI